MEYVGGKLVVGIFGEDAESRIKEFLETRFALHSKSTVLCLLHLSLYSELIKKHQRLRYDCGLYCDPNIRFIKNSWHILNMQSIVQLTSAMCLNKRQQ